MLEVQSLVKRYGDVPALLDLTLAVGSGECLVLIGRNGAGKTTALRCMAGVLQPTAGRVAVDGIDLAGDPDGLRARVGLMPEVPGLYERMSARAYLDHFGAIYDLPPAARRARIERLLELFDLAPAADRWMGTYSKGMRQKVALIRATLHQPRLVLADEPTSALDPDSARRAWAYLRELRESGAALVVCTHSMEEAEALAQPIESCDSTGTPVAGSIGIMSAGRLLALGSLDQLTERSRLRPRREVRRWPGLQEIYLAIVGEHFAARDRDESAASA